MLGNRTDTRFRIGAAIFALAALAGCGGSDAGPEQAIRAWVERGEDAAERRDRRELRDMISPDYRDGRGNDRDELDDLLRLVFLRQQNVALLVRIERLQVVGETAAELDLQVGMAGGSEGVFGFEADAWRFEMELQLEGEDWRLIGARWAEFGDDPH